MKIQVAATFTARNKLDKYFLSFFSLRALPFVSLFFLRLFIDLSGVTE